jgi:hypothetical protein
MNKATGPQGISNEMLKHLNESSLRILLNIFNACLKLQQIPKAWKQANIFPISKKPKFTGQLQQTRPISLIEHTRKIFTKIITNRIANICNKYSILSEHNHIALPNTSTALLISTLSHIFEDANIYKKELWTLSQDMSKAYDTVHIPLLIEALLRIKVSNSITSLIKDIFSERQNSVITNLGQTSFYPVIDGIDQGETITPLLWRIYYDPLITSISKQYKGYALQTQHTTNNNTIKHIYTSFSVLAYMDDTIWIAES